MSVEERSGAYDFGPREVRHIEMILGMVVGFANAQDVAIPELIGYLKLVEESLVSDVFRYLETRAEENPPEDS